MCSSYPDGVYCHMTVETHVELTEHQRALLKSLMSRLKRRRNVLPVEEEWTDKVKLFLAFEVLALLLLLNQALLAPIFIGL